MPVNRAGEGRRCKITIMGVDPGLATTGIGILEVENGVPVSVAYDCIVTNPRQTFPDRLNLIFENCKKSIRKYRPDEIAMERLFFARNVRTATVVGQAMGVLMLAAAKAQLIVHQYTPMEVKQSVTGSGTSPKRAVSLMLGRIIGLEEMPVSDDAADALAVAYCHYARTHRGQPNA